jgi:Fe-S-cluster containining protein
MPGCLAPGDLPLIMDYQGARGDPTAWLLEHFEASEGATAMKLDDAGRPVTFKIPTIVPKLTPTGCIFLKDGKCSIHPVAPVGCAYHDTHMGDKEGAAISYAMAVEQCKSWENHGSYAQAWEVLHAAGQDAAPLVERKAKLRAATLEIERRKGSA